VFLVVFAIVTCKSVELPDHGMIKGQFAKVSEAIYVPQAQVAQVLVERHGIF